MNSGPYSVIYLQLFDVEIPITVKLTVVNVDPGLKGDTAQGNATRNLSLIFKDQIYCVAGINAHQSMTCLGHGGLVKFWWTKMLLGQADRYAD